HLRTGVRFPPPPLSPKRGSSVAIRADSAGSAFDGLCAQETDAVHPFAQLDSRALEKSGIAGCQEASRRGKYLRRRPPARVLSAPAEWLVDNFHIVDDQLRQIREDLPRRFYRELPKLAAGFLEGYPRVFGVAWAFVAHTDSRFEPEALRRFVRAYQHVQPLMIGELWAVPITLRILLVENLRRLAERIVRDRTARQEADGLADRLLGLGGR